MPQSVESDLLASRVPELRNEQVHFRRTAPDLERPAVGLQLVGRAVEKLEAAGLVQIDVRLVDEQADEWGAEHSFCRITSTGASLLLGHPHLIGSDCRGYRAEQHLMTDCTFAEPNEVLRFTSVSESGYSRMWNDFPLRRRRSEMTAPVEFSSSPPVGQPGKSAQLLQPAGGWVCRLDGVWVDGGRDGSERAARSGRRAGRAGQRRRSFVRPCAGHTTNERSHRPQTDGLPGEPAHSGAHAGAVPPTIRPQLPTIRPQMAVDGWTRPDAVGQAVLTKPGHMRCSEAHSGCSEAEGVGFEPTRSFHP